ncbi:MAG: amidohydrolase family protein [SAR202 cluster bacterium]|nr:amidohydrolase family protein [SAR202 cluster bacterium]
MATKTMIKGGWVIGWGKEGHEVLEGGCVVVEGDRISFVGWPSDKACPKADRTIDAGGKLVTPGLVNLHCIANLDAQVFRMDAPIKEGSGYSKPEAWLMDPKAPNILSDEDYRVSALFSVATLLKAGSTSFTAVTTSLTKRWDDAEAEPAALVEASERLGARAWVGPLFREAVDYTRPDGTRGETWDRKKGQAAFDKAVSFAKSVQKKKHPLISPVLFPSRTDKCSDDLLKETIRQSKALGGIHVRSHFSEYLQEYREFKSKPENRDRTMVEWLRDVGFLGRNVCLTHAIYIAGHSDTGMPPHDDLQILSETGTSVGHCPVVFGRGGSRLESFSRYVNAGVNVGVGTDTFPPDLLDEMRVGSIIDKTVNKQRGTGTAKQFFDAATVSGAKALGREDIGRLEAGCQADITIWDFSKLDVGPVDDPLRTLVHFCNGRDADTVIVAGKTVVEGGRVAGLDEEELLHKAQRVWEKFKSGIVGWDWAKRTSEEVYPSGLPRRGRR